MLGDLNDVFCCWSIDLMILLQKSDWSPDWTELLSILADLAKLTEKMLNKMWTAT